MFYGYHFWGMNIIWWIIWIIFLFWIFFTPWGMRGRRYRSNDALEVLQRRFASGEITKEEYEERKHIIERDLRK